MKLVYIKSTCDGNIRIQTNNPNIFTSTDTNHNLHVYCSKTHIT